MFAVLVVQELTSSFLGPLLTFARAENPDHDFIAELREHAGDMRRPADAGTKTGEQGASDDDREVIEE